VARGAGFASWRQMVRLRTAQAELAMYRRRLASGEDCATASGESALRERVLRLKSVGTVRPLPHPVPARAA
jgi:hypothetical protein